MVAASGAALSKCGACRALKQSCSWGRTIPSCLNPIKIAIHRSRLQDRHKKPTERQGPEDSEARRDNAGLWITVLKLLADTTRAALYLTQVRIRETGEDGVKDMLEVFQKAFLQSSHHTNKSHPVHPVRLQISDVLGLKPVGITSPTSLNPTLMSS